MKMVSLKSLIAPSFYCIHLDIKNKRHTHYMLNGGRGSTKSSFVSIEIILGMMKDKNANGVALRKVGVNLKDSVYEQLQWAISALGVDNLWQGKVSPLELIYIPTGQRIIFRGADKPKKIKSTKFRKGYCKYLWYEEVDEFLGIDEIRNINQSLMRGGEKFIVFYSFNPPKGKKHWINMLSAEERNDSIFYKSTYLNMPKEWLGEAFFKEAEYLKETHPKEYEHEYMGEAVGEGGEVFENVVIRKISDEEIEGFDKVSRGLDWGYAGDPLHYTVNHYDRKKRRLYIFYEIHKKGLINQRAGEMIAEENRQNGIVICDSAEPKSIAELCCMGIKAIGAKKGQGSIEFGINWLRSLDEIIIDRQRCPETAREFLEYSLESDGDGGYRAYYPDKNNHSIDAVRYSRQFDIENVKVR